MSPSVAGILKDFLFNILVALKKTKNPTKNLPTCQKPERFQLVPVLRRAPRLRAVWEHFRAPETQLSGAAIFIKIPVFAWQNSGLEKQ